MSIDISNEVKKCKKLLLNGFTILYPTDTVWGIGCDATNHEAVKKVYKIKNRSDSKALICLVSDVEMLKHYVEYIPDAAYQIIKFSEKPTTIIYDKPKNISENLISDDNTIGFRITNNDFCKKLITKINKPIVSTSANVSGNPTPNSFKEIETDILKGVDYIVNLDLERKCTTPSTIIKLGNNGEVKIIR
ncbi:MAG: L-threonylcarbamoyladenylate synthase [Flavobacteriaceae bacterium]|jgi:L-threonylcarbamoyladenylate synthase|tara:strand:+ start:215 stop:784 length:570 start_codon:yes stop_codon:yes gene_type:complete